MICKLKSLNWSSFGSVMAAAAFLVLLASPATAVEHAELVTKFEKHSGPVLSLDFSPNGPLLVSGSEDGTVRAWDTKNGEQTRRFTRARSPIHSVEFSGDGRSLLVGGDLDELRYYNAVTGKREIEVDTVRGAQLSVAASPDGRFVASGGVDRVLTIWRQGDLEPLHAISAHEKAITGVAFSPDGEFVSSVGLDGSVRVWEVASGFLVFSVKLSGPLHDVEFGPDGQQVAVAGSDVKIIELKSSTIVRTLQGHEGKVLALAWSPDGQFIATGSSDMRGRLFSVTTGRVLEQFDIQKGKISAVAFSADGRLLATGSSGLDKKNGDNSIAVWDISEVYPDGRIARFVERQLYHWQQRGEFEKLGDYERRVSQTASQAGKLFGKAYRMFAEDVKEAAVISAYDADRERYRVSIPTVGEFDVRVPIEKAETFKKRFHEVVYRNFLVEPELQVPNRSSFELKRVELYLPSVKQSFFYERVE